MPANKDAEMRYRILDRLLGDKHRKYTIYDLLEVVNDQLMDYTGKSVSLRTLQKDIEELGYRPYCAPIVSTKSEGRRKYIHYSDPDFSLYNNDLSVEELKTLQALIDTLGRFRGSSTHAWLEEMLSKLEFRFGIKSDSKRLIAFEENEQLHGLEHLSRLIDATLHQQTLAVDYAPYHGVERRCHVHPYFMRQYNSRWFLLGYNTLKERIETYALDRIQSLRPLEESFIPSERIDFASYFEHVVGVSVPYGEETPTEVQLRFTEKRYPYVRSKPLHPSQREIEACTIAIKVIPTLELKQQILSFGADVEVIAPQKLREEIAEQQRAAILAYETM